VNVIRIATLSLLLAASVAGAQTKKEQEQAKAQMPKQMFTEKDIPKTCTDQCELMKKAITEPCKQGAGSNKAAQKDCETSTQQLVDACYGSCKEKGRLDKQYMMERIKPAGGKLPKGGQQGGGEDDAE
jgi:hypothetical protein